MVHALLVGIDAYRSVSRLRGCANDVDAVEELLRRKLPDELRVERLVSRIGSKPGDKPATLDAIRAALAALATGTDPALLWYAGHGTQLPGRSHDRGREALVPVDYRPGQPETLLWDVELNRSLVAIAQKRPLTVVLDCCSAAGTVRAARAQARSVAISVDPPPPADASPTGLLFSLGASGDPGFNVLAACQSDQTAAEVSVGDVQRGVLTWSLLELLEELRLQDTTWLSLWSALRARVFERAGEQCPTFIGRLERPILDGSAPTSDRGITARRQGEAWRLDAGELAGAATGARLALYPLMEPPRLPDLESDDDRKHRIGELEVTGANLVQADARFVGGPAPAGEALRARVISASVEHRLRVEVGVAGLEPVLANLLNVQLLGVGDPSAEFSLRPSMGGRVLVDTELGPLGPFLPVPDGEDGALRVALARALCYRRPLRLAALAPSWAGALHLRLLDAEAAAPLEDARDLRYSYLLAARSRFTIEVTNGSSRSLYVALLNCTMSGRVEVLAEGVQVPPGASQVFWYRQQVGAPFHAGLEEGRSIGVDRLVALGTTMPYATWAAMELRGRLRGSGTPPLGRRAPDRWTARAMRVAYRDPSTAASPMSWSPGLP